MNRFLALLLVLLCCGGTACSHVNDSGFWLVNQYFGMTVPQTLQSWTAMKIVSSLVGITVVMAAHASNGWREPTEQSSPQKERETRH